MMSEFVEAWRERGRETKDDSPALHSAAIAIGTIS